MLDSYRVLLVQFLLLSQANAFNELVLRFLKKHIAELSSQTERTAAQ